MNIAVIFDMDGVLIDSQPLHYELDMRVLKSCGYPAVLETVTPYTGIGNPERWPKYRQNLQLSQEPAELIAMAEEAARNIFTSANLPPIDGVAILINGIKALGIPLGVASSSSRELISLVLQKIGLADKFDFVVSGEDVSEGKPSPEIYLKAAEKAGVAPEFCLAIEDSAAGILAAKNAGIPCIAFKNPSTVGQDFTHATHVISRFDDAFPIIKTAFFRGAGAQSAL
ncbi:MAG: HAD family hydrolase [Defluviitaleaceae bacterium]|nr:HAD family hydrolase [Defluviitaleaceae bacterium]